MKLAAPLLVLGLTVVCPAVPVPEVLLRTEETIARVSEQLNPTVVHIEVWSRRSGQSVKSQGSGLIVSSDGTLVTNHHVVDRAEQILVVLADKSRYTAQVLRSDRLTDLAVLKITPARPLPAATLADSDKARVGQLVLAIGNPYGLDGTVSFGIISGKGRYMADSESGLSPLNDFLQTDATIDAGSSGGPLVDLEGRVLGINSSGLGRGIGFTIPSKVVREVLSGKQAGGQLERGWIGILAQPLSRELARHLGRAEMRGILVSDTLPDSPAQKAGLRSGDILLDLDGETVEAESEDEIVRFAQQVSRYAPGQQFSVGLFRDGERMRLPLQVGLQPLLDAPQVETGYGFTVEPVNSVNQQQFRLTRSTGLVVSEVQAGTAAEESGLEKGDLLLDWEGRPVQELSDLQPLLKGPPRPALLKVRRAEYVQYVFLQPRGKTQR